MSGWTRLSTSRRSSCMSSRTPSTGLLRCSSRWCAPDCSAGSRARDSTSGPRPPRLSRQPSAELLRYPHGLSIRSDHHMDRVARAEQLHPRELVDLVLKTYASLADLGEAGPYHELVVEPGRSLVVRVRLHHWNEDAHLLYV